MDYENEKREKKQFILFLTLGTSIVSIIMSIAIFLILYKLSKINKTDVKYDEDEEGDREKKRRGKRIQYVQTQPHIPIMQHHSQPPVPKRAIVKGKQKSNLNTPIMGGQMMNSPIMKEKRDTIKNEEKREDLSWNMDDDLDYDPNYNAYEIGIQPQLYNGMYPPHPQMYNYGGHYENGMGYY